MKSKKGLNQFKPKKNIIILSVFVLLSLYGCTFCQQSLLHDGRARTYLLHLPVAYDSETPVPLVIVLHGGGGNPGNAQNMTGMNEKANAKGFIAVYPAGSGVFTNSLLTWNAGFCCKYSLENSIDDVGFIRTLIEELQTRYTIASDQIYITGLSNGGMQNCPILLQQ